MKTKKAITENWFPRYTSTALEDLGEFVLLTNFTQYVKLFQQIYGGEIKGKGGHWQTCTSKGISIINFGMGSPSAATVMDLLSAKEGIKACLFLGKCGGLKPEHSVGDLLLPIGAIRNEGTSDEYLPKEVPALPALAMQKVVSTAIREKGLDYCAGTVLTTNRRIWEHDEEYKTYLKRVRADAIDMETATLFVVGFFNKIPTGALLLISDEPMTPEGVKTEESDKKVSSSFVRTHLECGIQSLEMLKNDHQTVKHLKVFY